MFVFLQWPEFMIKSFFPDVRVPRCACWPGRWCPCGRPKSGERGRRGPHQFPRAHSDWARPRPGPRRVHPELTRSDLINN